VDGAPRPKKPWHFWILQAIVAVQVLWSIVRIVPGLRGIAPHLREPAVIWWLVETKLVWAVSILFVLSLQRIGFRRPDIIAPVTGLLWWANGLYRAISGLGQPTPPDLKGVMFEDVPADSAIAGTVIVHGLLFALIATLLWHRKSRAYLVGAPPDVSPASNPAGAS